MKKTIQTILLVIYIFGNNTIAQDLNFSQFYNSEVLINPAFTGNKNGKLRFIALHRRQWQSVAVPYKSVAFAVDKSIMSSKNMYLSAGLLVINDNSGDSKFKTFIAAANLAASVKTSTTSLLSSGLQLGFYQNSLNLSGLSWDAQYNGRNYDASLSSLESINTTSVSGISSAFGLAYTFTPSKFNSVKIGLSGFNFVKINNSYFNNQNETLNQRYNLFVATETGSAGNNVTYLPSFLIQKQGPALNITAGILFSYKLGMDSRITNVNKSSAFIWGVHYRFSDAVIPSIHYKFKRRFSAGLSYDINFSKLTPTSRARGGFELCLNYFASGK